MVKLVREYDLGKTMECGQLFHFEKTGSNCYTVAQGDKFCRVKQIAVNKLEMEFSNERDGDYWDNFFNIVEMEDPVVLQTRMKMFFQTNDIAEAGKGLKILNQDPWETCVAFALSPQKRVPQIKECLQRVSELSCRFLADGMFQIPNPSELFNHSLLGLGLGYRSSYLKGIAEIVIRNGGLGWLESLKQLDNREACNALRQAYGIGPKVANCIALYGLGKTKAFPVDIQIEHAFNKLKRDYSVDVTAEDIINEFEYDAGLVQLYLYQWIRNI